VNNKYVKYFLIVAVVGVWAAIVYRVVHGLGGAPVPHGAPGVASVKEYKLDEDTFQLYADYPDPFLGDADSDSAKADTMMRKAGVPVVPGPPSPPVQPRGELLADLLQYNGTISNPKRKARVAIITFQGKEYLVREKDKLGDVRVLKIERDRIVVLYKGEVFTIAK
jgi:hypothetical protein